MFGFDFATYSVKIGIYMYDAYSSLPNLFIICPIAIA